MGTTIIKSRSARQTKAKEMIIFVICLACIFLFLSSAYTKFADHERFVRGLAKVAFIGKSAPVVGWLVPIAEVVISILLIIPKSYRLGLYAFSGLMTIFTLYIGAMMIWADKLPCGCNLFIEKLGWRGHLIFNIGFISLSIYALWLERKSNQ